MWKANTDQLPGLGFTAATDRRRKRGVGWGGGCSAAPMMFHVKSCDAEVMAEADLQGEDVHTRLLAVC